MGVWDLARGMEETGIDEDLSVKRMAITEKRMLLGRYQLEEQP